MKIHLNKSRFAEILEKFSTWTQRTEDVVQQFGGFSDQKSVQVLEDILFLTSLLEHSVGNVFCTLTSRTPPHLLKDLLEIQEVKEFFGKDKVIYCDFCSYEILMLHFILDFLSAADHRNAKRSQRKKFSLARLPIIPGGVALLHQHPVCDNN